MCDPDPTGGVLIAVAGTKSEKQQSSVELVNELAKLQCDINDLQNRLSEIVDALKKQSGK